MKHHIYYSLILLLLLTAFQGRAQSQKLYSFTIKSTSELLTYNQENLGMASARTGINSLAQHFIVKRLNNNSVLIAAAANPGLFLKRDGSAIVLAAYITNDNSFEWELVYSGYPNDSDDPYNPYLSIAASGANSFLSWQSGSGFGMVSTTALSSNSDSSGNHYRFALSNVTNTF